MKRYLPFVIIGAVLVIALVAGAVMFRSAEPQTASLPATVATPNHSQAAGAPRGAVTIEEYGDYQCPPCGNLHLEIKKLKREFGDRIRVVFYQFPLPQIHRNAVDAAHAAVAARLQGKFWEMHDLLYASQREWAELPDLRPIAASFASQLRLDMGRFARDMDGPQVAAVVADDMRRGESLGVTGTPTLFIEGQQVKDDDMTPEKLRQIISQRLSGN